MFNAKLSTKIFALGLIITISFTVVFVWLYPKIKKSAFDGKYVKTQHLVQTATSAINHFVALTADGKMSEQNAATSEESASASEEMSAQAEQMKSMVNELLVLVMGTAKDSRKKSPGPNRPILRLPGKKNFGGKSQETTEEYM